jgi:hypothetical protein
VDLNPNHLTAGVLAARQGLVEENGQTANEI